MSFIVDDGRLRWRRALRVQFARPKRHLAPSPPSPRNPCHCCSSPACVVPLSDAACSVPRRSQFLVWTYALWLLRPLLVEVGDDDGNSDEYEEEEAGHAKVCGLSSLALGSSSCAGPGFL